MVEIYKVITCFKTWHYLYDAFVAMPDQLNAFYILHIQQQTFFCSLSPLS